MGQSRIQVGPAFFQNAFFEIEVYPNCSQNHALSCAKLHASAEICLNRRIFGITFSN